MTFFFKDAAPCVTVSTHLAERHAFILFCLLFTAPPPKKKTITFISFNVSQMLSCPTTKMNKLFLTQGSKYQTQDCRL